MLRRSVALITGLAALGLLAYGMLQPVGQETRWLLALWAAAPLLLLAAAMALPRQSPGTARSIQNLGLVVGLGFVLLALQLLRQQFIYSETLSNLIYVDEQTGQTTSNVRRVFEALQTKRGRILDRNGVVLVDTQIVEGGFAVRTYPLADQFDPAAFSNVVGFFSHRYGEAGLEATYGPYLDGERDSLRRVQDSILGRQRVGDDIHLTLDARLQAAAHRALGGRTGSVVVLDPRSGAVLAMVSNPGFDPRGLAFNPAADREAENARIEAYWSQINGEASGQPLLNRPTQSRYPPGSTFKTLTAIGVLEHPREGRPDEIDCPNQRETEPGAPPVVNAVPNLFERTGNPSNLERVYAFSCNTAFAEYAMRLGQELMAETARAFDIFRPQEAPDLYGGFTDLPTAPSLLYLDAGFLNRRAGLADTGFGQGQLFVTPLQMAMIAAAVANDGVMMYPYLVERVTRPEGGVVTAQGPRAIRRAMSPQVAALMRANMRAAVAYGFGAAADAVEGAQVGGKSGTAEYPCPTPEAPGLICAHAWFIAIAPADSPQVAVAVMVEGGGEGSSVGGALAGEVLAAALRPQP